MDIATPCFLLFDKSPVNFQIRSARYRKFIRATQKSVLKQNNVTTHLFCFENDKIFNMIYGVKKLKVKRGGVKSMRTHSDESYDRNNRNTIFLL